MMNNERAAMESGIENPMGSEVAQAAAVMKDVDIEIDPN